MTQDALHYHATFPAGKVEIVSSKPLKPEDLKLAYSPGVAEPCQAIHQNPEEAYRYTSKGHLVAVITDGTAVLGLGNIGPLAGKPVMEGKSLLFKIFAGLDSFDLEIASKSSEHFIETVAALEPTFGGINLEDIAAPHCFEIEAELKKRLKIPVFHDDQHGTAIVVVAAVLNGLRHVHKKIDEIKVVVSGAGAAALASLELLCEFGLNKKNIFVFDSKGLIYQGRSHHEPYRWVYAQESGPISLEQAFHQADLFLGLSGPGLVTPQMIESMAPKPIVLAMANPIPEILPEVIHQVRQDALVGTGRSDYPNQVNNTLCFPYLFRGALDVRASSINLAMKKACAQALADLVSHEPAPTLIPQPFDPRLLEVLPIAVAQAAIDSGVAQSPISDWERYRHSLRVLRLRTQSQLSAFAAASVLSLEP